MYDSYSMTHNYYYIYRGEKFIIKPSQLKTDEHRPDEVVFYSESAAVNEIILELCQGNHHLFFQVSYHLIL